MEIDFQYGVEQAKRDLANVPGFSIRRCFKAMDEANTKFIDESSLRRYLKKVGHSPLKSELIAIMRRLDIDGDKRISFEEFSEALSPLALKIYRHPKKENEDIYSPCKSHLVHSQIDYPYLLKLHPVSEPKILSHTNTYSDQEPSFITSGKNK
jgi:hypothetical protein